MNENNKVISEIELPPLEVLKKELKREKYKRRFRRVLRLTVNNLIVVAAVAASGKGAAVLVHAGLVGAVKGDHVGPDLVDIGAVGPVHHGR